MRFPLFSFLLATWTDASTAAPLLMPQKTPSSLAIRRAMSMASSPEIWITSSKSDVSAFPGMKPAPMPWILCGPGFPPDKTGDSTGSMATIRSSGFFSFRYCPEPVSVPPVPTCDRRRRREGEEEEEQQQEWQKHETKKEEKRKKKTSHVRRVVMQDHCTAPYYRMHLHRPPECPPCRRSPSKFRVRSFPGAPLDCPGY